MTSNANNNIVGPAEIRFVGCIVFGPGRLLVGRVCRTISRTKFTWRNNDRRHAHTHPRLSLKKKPVPGQTETLSRLSKLPLITTTAFNPVPNAGDEHCVLYIVRRLEYVRQIFRETRWAVIRCEGYVCRSIRNVLRVQSIRLLLRRSIANSRR